jgi:hypothetical protein
MIEPLERRFLRAGDFVFASTAGGAGKDKATDVAVDSAGNCYVVGVYNGAIDFDPSSTRTVTLPNTASDDAFVAKYSPAGALFWAIAFSGGGTQEAQSVAIDANGDLLVTGWYSSTVDFNPSPAASFTLMSKGDEDGFVAKLSSAGLFLWAKSFGGSGREGGLSAAVDAARNVYVQGMFSASGDYDPGVGTFQLTSAGSYDVSLLKLDPSGNFVFAKRFGGTGEDMGNGLATDPSGNILSLGSFSGTLDFDPNAGAANLSAAGGSDVFVSKLTSGGSYVWAKRLGGTVDDTGGDIAFDSAGNIYATGSFSGTADFDPSGSSTYTRTSKGSSDAFIVKLSSSGSLGWAKILGGSSADKGNGIAVDSTGVFVTGKFAGSSVDFNPSTSSTYYLSSSGGSTDIFAMKLGLDGAFKWARRVGGSTSLDEGEGIAVRSGSVWIAGGFAGSVDFDPGTGTATRVAGSSSQYDAFVLRLSDS